jgi:hypothetical protein
VGLTVEIFNVLRAQERQASLELFQVFVAQNVVSPHLRTPGHDPGILSDSPFVRRYVRVWKMKGE